MYCVIYGKSTPKNLIIPKLKNKPFKALKLSEQRNAPLPINLLTPISY